MPQRMISGSRRWCFGGSEGSGGGNLPDLPDCFNVFISLYFVHLCTCSCESSWTSSLKTLELCCLWQSFLKVWYLIAPWNGDWNKLDLMPWINPRLCRAWFVLSVFDARIWGQLSCHFQTKLQSNNLRSYFIKWCCVLMLGKPSRCGLWRSMGSHTVVSSRFLAIGEWELQYFHEKHIVKLQKRKDLCIPLVGRRC